MLRCPLVWLRRELFEGYKSRAKASCKLAALQPAKSRLNKCCKTQPWREGTLINFAKQIACAVIKQVNSWLLMNCNERSGMLQSSLSGAAGVGVDRGSALLWLSCRFTHGFLVLPLLLFAFHSWRWRSCFPAPSHPACINHAAQR